MRNGGIGRGWHPEEPEDEVQVLATDLLKSKLAEVFKMMQENKNNGRVCGVTGGRFGLYK